MSLGQYTNFIEPSQIPQNVAWMFISWGAQFLLTKLIKRHKIQINRKTIWKSFQMMKLFGKILHFVSIAYTQNILNKLHIKKFDKWFHKSALRDLTSGFMIFREIEPEAADAMIRIFMRYYDQYEVSKITGLFTAPDLSELKKLDNTKYG